MKDVLYVYDPDRIVTLIRITPRSRVIWSVEILRNSDLERIFTSNQSYDWQVDCDLDTFLLFQNEIESEDTDRVLSKRTIADWVHFSTPGHPDPSNLNQPIQPDQLTSWLDTSFSEIKSAEEKGEYPYSDLLPIIAVDEIGEILMQAWGNREALLAGLETGKGNYFSRSRNKFWTKGEESGHIQTIQSWTLRSKFPFTIIYHVIQKGAACHTGKYSCFFRKLTHWNDPSVTPV